MRQRRQRLQVSTFPFLAVLLCAMGSLILLLLVIDRRAKVVARAKALRVREQAEAQASADVEKRAAAQAAEWERRRQLLHAQLQQQDQQLLGQLRTVEGKTSATAGTVQAELAHHRELQDQLEAERSGLVQSDSELAVRRAASAHAAHQTETTRTELVHLTADLERMERTLADLKLARQRQPPCYSLVPYRGKRGDHRKPVYVECTGEEIIFHPDHLALRGPTLTPSSVRDEIEHRLAQQHAEINAVSAQANEDAYLLMLIRPNGIATYYRILGALRGLRLDFGYEFIDQDWALDFSEHEDTPTTEPWRVTEGTKQERPSAAAAKPVPATGPAVTGRPSHDYQGVLSGGPVPGRSLGTSAATSGGQGSVSSPLADNRFAQSSGPPGPPSARSNDLLLENRVARPESAKGVQNGPPTPFADSGRATGFPPFAQEVFGSSTREGSPGDRREPGSEALPGLVPAGTTNRGEATANPGEATANAGLDSVANSARGSADPGRPASGQSDSGEAAPGPAVNPLERFAAPKQARQAIRSVPARAGPLISNRDWILVVECTADALVVQPSGQRLTLSEIAKGESGTSPLLELIERLIARRQATVRPSEPPYRPMIRFRVRPDGLRSYYLAYPVLEALHVPMTRENLDSAEEKTANREH